MIGDAAPVMHWDLDKTPAASTSPPTRPERSTTRTGTARHVLATMVGTGTSDPRYRGMATAAGTIEELRAAKVLDKNKQRLRHLDRGRMDFMSGFSLCESAPPLRHQCEPGVRRHGWGRHGQTVAQARRHGLDCTASCTWSARATGDRRPQTIDAPGWRRTPSPWATCSIDSTSGSAISTQSSSRGPDRRRPHEAERRGPGNKVTSAKAGTTNSYTDKDGTSMAAPHVTGLAATLMDHYP